jgi:hypothetical protein
MAIGYSYLAFLDLELGKHAAAANLYNKATSYYQLARDERGVAKCFGNLADIYESTGQRGRAWRQLLFWSICCPPLKPRKM